MKYTKKHIAAVERRLQQYEEVLASPTFRRLGKCGICHTTTGNGGLYPDCERCLFNHNETFDAYGQRQDEGCSSVNPYDGWKTGAWCETKDEQRKQFKYLLKQLGKNGYEWR